MYEIPRRCGKSAESVSHENTRKGKNKGYTQPRYMPVDAPKVNPWEKRMEKQQHDRARSRARSRSRNFTHKSQGGNMKEEIQRLFGTSASRLQEFAEKFHEEYKALTTDKQRKDAIGRYYLNINQCR